MCMLRTYTLPSIGRSRLLVDIAVVANLSPPLAPQNLSEFAAV